jgi:hypothetical protein
MAFPGLDVQAVYKCGEKTIKSSSASKLSVFGVTARCTITVELSGPDKDAILSLLESGTKIEPAKAVRYFLLLDYNLIFSQSICGLLRSSKLR